MILKKIRQLGLSYFAVVIIPFNQAEWKSLEYSKIRPNKVEYSNGMNSSLKLNIDHSASPPIYKLDKALLVKSLSFKGKIAGRLNFQQKIQGETGADDFSVRVGVVIEGNKTLNFMQKMITPRWIKELYSLGNGNTGIDRIEFFNISNSKLTWQQRIHPLSDLIKENIVAVMDTGDFEVKYNFDKSVKVVAIWVSSDGDDTKSKYEVNFSQIALYDDLSVP
ncbi:MAG: hypothetical protein EHM20_03335 [Alphaproteobacteria bacterium]|nr:MAG: hypothetical protein EHM20_03335 [Alphaproteobacteria bacterium]